MEQKKGRGGYRPGAGRPKGSKTKNKVDVLLDAIQTGGYTGTDAKLYLEDLLSSPTIDRKTKIKIAGILLPYQYQRKEENNKKDERAERAERAAQGKFAPGKPPIKTIRD